VFFDLYCNNPPQTPKRDFIIHPKPLKGILITSVSYSHSFDVSTPANHSYSPSGVRGASLSPISME